MLSQLYAAALKHVARVNDKGTFTDSIQSVRPQERDMPLKHVTQIDDESVGNGLNMLPLPVCVDLEPRAVISGKHSQRTIICVCTSSIHTLHQTKIALLLLLLLLLSLLFTVVEAC